MQSWSDSVATDPITWALGRLDAFVADATKVMIPPPPGVIAVHSVQSRGGEDTVVTHWAVVQYILSTYLPDWRDRVQPLDEDEFSWGYRWAQQREAAQQCRALGRSFPGGVLVDHGRSR
jgi:hypothetical protein